MRFKEMKGHKIVDISTAETVGKVDEFIVDPAASRVVALKVGKSQSGGLILRWEDLEAFGADAVTVSSAEQIGSGDDAINALLERDHALLGKRALSTRGDELGKIEDVEFDPSDGAVQALAVGDHDVAGGRLVGAGSYAVMLEPAAE